ncbi:hypothetical protein COCCADRAFT_103267 [Bipolaris zeicola 26-R-13]|uniref:Protein kinase domain-containing protein n=1 Tax=Cochliobolus carbonum (strain 26-R-13) TaxID=930089 RepID=W6XSZ2_COCC2|nr:uncharacterized protein COCCADRAFT_103267 [Bipolaris zeicola 26-R-13]EUC30682.1 hypothetical protein COCCADRAFT_103267 [Bipolaris zeicola 26-R-13]
MAVNIEAQYAAQQIDFATLEQIYIPRTLEVGWIHSIQSEGGHGEDFRLFVIGHKLKHWQRTGTIPSEKKVIHAWGNTDAISREPFIVIAESEPDPRLHQTNFENHAALLTYADKHVRQEEHNDFRAFVYGCRVTDIRLRAESQAQTLINRWKDRTPAEHTHYITRGRQFYERHVVQFPHLRPAGAGDHLYARDPIPKATMSDIAFVNLHDPRPANEPKKPAGSRWVFERTLMQVPEATFGDYQTQRIVHLFVLVSADHIILKRMVVKITGSLTTRDVEKNLNREYDKAHKKLSDVPCPHILKAYGSAIRRRTSSPQLGYIFMEYAEHGDLGDYLAKHAVVNPGKQLPEPFLWLVFRAMAEAVFVMALGRPVPKHLPLDSYGEGLNLKPVEGWKPIINPDIKTYNIVFAAPQPDYYPAYPTPKMIDFGLCFDDDYFFENPQYKALGVGTNGFGPPEHDYKNFPDYRNQPIDIASEIFNVGLIMLNMMEPWVSRGMTSTEHSQLGFEHHENYSYSYSSRLEELVFRCLEFPRRKRPALTEVLYFTRVGLREWENAYGSVSKTKENLLGFAKVEVDGVEEEVAVGKVAPRRWKGMRERREKVAGQGCVLMRKAEEAGVLEGERAAKRVRFVSGA